MKHRNILEAWMRGEQIYVKDIDGAWDKLDDFDTATYVYFADEHQYSIGDPYLHLREAYASGKKIEVQGVNGEWYALRRTDFDLPLESYRIAPVIMRAELKHNGRGMWVWNESDINNTPNIEVEWQGDEIVSIKKI